ncbi:class I SAM-dependent methyltransferase [Halogeometricum sp. CBA1124]|uniref:class I SAM-dependent methyltransferase n=1 Tax=Halogeometricum sp. CBA1124 TaxID=2668071 RepID=UPI001E2DA300|nr:class I SAM-dependent methyltransferase [Halogeometricum sp. CBA1124]
MPDDALGTAMWDYLRGDYDGSCVHRDPATGETWDARVEHHYFEPYAAWSDAAKAFANGLETPLLDAGCGAGKHARVVSLRGRVVAFDASPMAVRTARARGVDAFVADMFRPPVRPDRFETALVNGTQATLSQSDAELRDFLGELARVTTATGDAWVARTTRPGPPGRTATARRTRRAVGRRRFRVEYRGRDLVGPRLSFRTFSPDRLRDTCEGTAWSVAEVRRYGDVGYFRARLAK